MTQQPVNYVVTCENYEGECKKFKVAANDPYEAMAMCQKNGWFPVEVKPI